MIIIQQQQDDKCEYCGNIAELRPYGKNNEMICFKCAMKDEKTTKVKFAENIDSQEKVAGSH